MEEDGSSLLSSMSDSSCMYSLYYDDNERELSVQSQEMLSPDVVEQEKLSRTAKWCMPWLRTYTRRMVLSDFVAGLTVGVIAVPQALSYATVAGLMPVHGLYAALIGIIPYVFIGSSPHLVAGPTAVMSIIVKSSIPRMYHSSKVLENTTQWTLLCYAVAFISGVIQVVLGSLGIGFFVELISEPVISGFTSAAALLIISTQIASVLGIRGCDPSEMLGPAHAGEECYLPEVIYSTISNLHLANLPTVICSFITISVLLLFKLHIKKRNSIIGSLGPLLVISGTISFIYLLTENYGSTVKHVGNTTQHFEGRFHIRYVGSVPSGLPSVSNPVAVIHDFRDVALLLQHCIPVVLIGLMEAITIAKTVARKIGFNGIEPAREFLGLGASNLFCSAFQGYAVTGSFSRTSVNVDSGAKSQISNLFAAVVVAVTLVFLTSVVQYTPKFALGSIVITSVISLIDISEARLLWKTQRTDFSVFAVVFVATLGMGVTVGLVSGISLSWVLSLREAKPVLIAAISCVLNDVDVSYADQSVLCVVVPHSNLTFGNVGKLRSSLQTVKSIFDPRWIVVDCSRINTFDSSGLKLLYELSQTVAAGNVYGNAPRYCIVNVGPFQLEQLNQLRLFKKEQSGQDPWSLVNKNNPISDTARLTVFVGSLADAVKKLKSTIVQSNHRSSPRAHWVPLCPQFSSIEQQSACRFVSFENIGI